MDGRSPCEGSSFFSLRLCVHRLKTHVKSLDGVGECTDRNEVDTAFGIVAEGLVGDATGRFRFKTVINQSHRLSGVFDREIVEHDAVGATVFHHLADVVEGAAFNLDFQIQPLFFEVGCTAVERFVDANIRIPGVVLRVSSTRVPVPSSRFT